MKTLSLGLLIFIYFSSSWAQSLNEVDRDQLDKNSYVFKREMINGAPWPKLTFFVLLKGSPEECMAIFSDFERQREYVPGILESKVIARPSAHVAHTKYELKMPWPLPNSHYIHGTTINQPSNNNFTIKWFVVESDSTEKIEGGASFEVYDEGRTLMTYESLIYPKSIFARLFAGTMVDDTKASIMATKDFIEAKVRDKSGDYQRALSLLRAGLSEK